MQRTIQLQIDRLVIDESLIARGDRGRLEAVLTRELERLCADCIPPGMSGALAALTGGTITASSKTDVFGKAIASHVHDTLRAAISPGPASSERTPQ